MADYVCTSYVGIEQLIDSVNNADFVISVLPATTQTDDLIGEALFSAMPEQSYFINVGRGNAVDEQALMNALNNSDIAGAALDVFKQEPLPEHHPFWQISQLTITPHISAITDQHEVVQQIAENYRQFTLGKALNNQVDVNKGY